MEHNTVSLTRKQNLFVVEVILTAAFEAVENCLPDADNAENLTDPRGLSPYAEAALNNAGLALSILYAQQSNAGFVPDDALYCADKFADNCRDFVVLSWQHKQLFLDAVAERRGTAYERHDLYKQLFGSWPGSFPDPAYHAQKFVESTFDEDQP